ncbi:hypothetical protein U1Q18_040559 [Sarracenia purpurea var. burkii]
MPVMGGRSKSWAEIVAEPHSGLGDLSKANGVEGVPREGEARVSNSTEQGESLSTPLIAGKDNVDSFYPCNDVSVNIVNPVCMNGGESRILAGECMKQVEEIVVFSGIDRHVLDKMSEPSSKAHTEVPTVQFVGKSQTSDAVPPEYRPAAAALSGEGSMAGVERILLLELCFLVADFRQFGESLADVAMIEKGVSASVTAVKRVEEVDSGLESMSRKLITGTKLGLASLWRRAYSDYSRERSLIRRGRGELLSLESSPLGVHDAPSSLGSLGPFPWLWWDVSKALEARSPLWSDLEHRDGPRHRLCCSSVCFVFSWTPRAIDKGGILPPNPGYPVVLFLWWASGEFVGIGLGPPISRGTNSLLGRALGFKDGAQV